jgi:hypothetical protein
MSELISFRALRGVGGPRDLLADWSPEQHAELADLLSRRSRATTPSAS